MLSYCLKCRNNTKSENLEVVKIKDGRIMLLSKFSLFNSKKSTFLTEQEAKRLLSRLGLKRPLGKVPFLDLLLF